MTYQKVHPEDSNVDCEFSDVNVEEQTPLEDLNTRGDDVYADQPTRILEWLLMKDVTWKNKDRINAEYPYLFYHYLSNLEDEIHLKGVEL